MAGFPWRRDSRTRASAGVRGASCAEKFAREGVGVSITVTPCWCYGSETMDMDPLVPKAVWGFNGTERPGAVYLARFWRRTRRRGCRRSASTGATAGYGRFVHPGGCAGEAAEVRSGGSGGGHHARGASYLAMGAVSMGIAGSIVDNNLFESYLGMRVEQCGYDRVHPPHRRGHL